MNVFELRDRLIADYGDYVRSFIEIRDEHIQKYLDQELDGGLLWPDPLIQVNCAFEAGGAIDELAHYLKIPKSTLYKLAKEGKVPGQKVGRRWRLREQTIDRRLDQGDPGMSGYSSSSGDTRA